MLKLMKIMLVLVPVPAPGEAAQRVLGRESEDLSFAPVTANNKCFFVQKSHFTAPLGNRDNYSFPFSLVELL